MRILFTGGGTGGHVLPNVAIIEELKKQNKNISFLYLGSKKGPEKELINSINITFKEIMTGKLRRYFSWENFFDLFRIPIGFFESLLIIRKFNPDIIFSKGGFVSVPVVLAGAILGKKIIIHESDVSPGLSTKICSKVADKICLAQGDNINQFKKNKVIVTGTPLRPGLKDGDKVKGKKFLGFNGNLPILLIMGGSLGAKKLNNFVEKNILELIKVSQVIHIFGQGKQPKINLNINDQKKYKGFSFLKNDLNDIYAASDLVLTRAGANTLSELIELKKIMILVPLPLHSSRGDQIENALKFRKLGLADVVTDDDVDLKLKGKIFELIKDGEKRKKIETKLKKIPKNEATKKIVKLIIKTYENRN